MVLPLGLLGHRSSLPRSWLQLQIWARCASECRGLYRTLNEALAPLSPSKVEGELTGILQRLYEHRRRRTYFMGFAQNPVDFINAMVASQARRWLTLFLLSFCVWCVGGRTHFMAFAQNPVDFINAMVPSQVCACFRCVQGNRIV